MLFLYHATAGALPDTPDRLATVLRACVSRTQGRPCIHRETYRLFPRVYDTKFIADFVVCERASYLGYLYGRHQRLCAREQRTRQVHAREVLLRRRRHDAAMPP